MFWQHMLLFQGDLYLYHPNFKAYMPPRFAILLKIYKSLTSSSSRSPPLVVRTHHLLDVACTKHLACLLPLLPSALLLCPSGICCPLKPFTTFDMLPLSSSRYDFTVQASNRHNTYTLILVVAAPQQKAKSESESGRKVPLACRDSSKI